MRVSIINLNLVAEDAIGNTIIEQVRFFAERGDQVTVFVLEPPKRVAQDIATATRVVTLVQLREDSDFRTSDLYIYHYPSRYSLIETIAEQDSGFVIFYYHNVTPPELWNREEERPILRTGVEGVTLATYADLVVSPSTYNLANLSLKIHIPPERMVELPLAVDTAAFRPGPAPDALRRQYCPDEGPLLLFVGRMAHNKRIDILVRALAAVRCHPLAPQPTARLLLVGDNASSPAYRSVVQEAEQYARELGVADGVMFAGRVDDLPGYYNLASVYVCASQHEGFCVPLIEAMASGVPVVAAANTAMPGTVGDAGLLVPVDSAGQAQPADMAEAIVRVLTDPDLACDLRARGQERVTYFTIEKYRERLAALVDTHVTNLPLRPRAAACMGATLDDTTSDARAFWPELSAEARVAMPEYVVRSRAPVVGRLLAWVRRNMTSHLKEPYVDLIVQRQQAFNLRAAWTINELTRRLVRVDRQFEAEDEKLKRLHAHQFRLESQVARLEARLAEVQLLPGSASAAAPWLPGMEPQAQQIYGINYRSCNEIVGGAPEIELALYRTFVPFFGSVSGPVLDLGCGRGTFLQVMRAEDIPAMGIDLDPEMVDYCRSAGLDAAEDDVFEALQRQPDGSLGGIFCAHVIEHLPRQRLMELAGLCWQKLRPGAAVVWITPNGGGLTTLHAAFYKDLTHTRPLHPDTLAFIFQASGFVYVQTRTLSEMPEVARLQLLPEDGDVQTSTLNANLNRLNDVIFGDLDCAAIARRP